MLEIDLNLGIETRFIFGDYNYIGLRKLYLRRCITTADVIDLVAKHIPYLEVLDCETPDPFPQRAFEPLIDVLSRIGHVRFHEFNMNVLQGPLMAPVAMDRYIRTSVEMVWTFQNAPNLQALNIGTQSMNCDRNGFATLMRTLTIRSVG